VTHALRTPALLPCTTCIYGRWARARSR
jgi:hypothetical protein